MCTYVSNVELVLAAYLAFALQKTKKKQLLNEFAKWILLFLQLIF